jgi:hypothetical protein
MHTLANAWEAPFFYEDRRHVFYVTTKARPFTIREFKRYPGLISASPVRTLNIPPLVLHPKPRITDRVGPISSEHYQAVSNLAPIERFVSEDAYIKQALGSVDTVQFGGVELGPAGAVSEQR